MSKFCSVLIALFAISCGGSSGGGGAAPESGLEDPSKLVASKFEDFIPKLRSESEIASIMETYDLTNYTETTANQSCVRNKIIFNSEDENGYFQATLPATEMSDCFAESEFSGYSSITVQQSAIVRSKITLDGEPISLEGKKLSDIGKILTESDFQIFELELFQQMVTKLIGKVKANDNDEIITWKSLLQKADGIPVKYTITKDGPYKESPSNYFYLMTQLINGQVVDEQLNIESSSKELKADAYDSTYYQNGETKNITIDNWSGTITYKGANVNPEYILTDGQGGEVRSNAE